MGSRSRVLRKAVLRGAYGAAAGLLTLAAAWGQSAPPAAPPAPPAPSGAPVVPAGETAAPAAGPAAITSRIQKFYAPHDKDGKRIALAEGEWAILRGQDQVDLIQPVFTLFRDIEGESRREKIVVSGATGFYDRAAHRARLEGQVTVRQEDGTELRADALDIDILQKRLATDGRVELRKPGLTLTGTGLEASEILSLLVLRATVILNVRGTPGVLLKDAPAARAGEGGAGSETTMTCEGPATLVRLTVPRPGTGATEELRLARGVVITRHEPVGIMRLTGDAATLDLYHGAPPAPPPGVPAAAPAPEAPPRVTQVRRADLTGSVQLVDAQGLSGSAQRLVWSPADDRLDLSGRETGVRVVRGVSALQGRQVTMDRRSGLVVCREDAQMTFVPDAGPGEGGAARAAVTPWMIRCDELTMRMTADRKGLDAVDAAGRVTLTGEIGAAAGSVPPARQTAAGDRFVWEGAARRGLLSGAPVTLAQGGHRMEAARVVFFPLDQRVVLQGPKRIELASEAAAAPVPAGGGAPVPAGAASEGGIVLTAAGDIAIAAGDGTIEVGDRAQILSPQTRLDADRLRIRLAAGGGVDRALGWGHVRLSDRASGAEVFGDHLAWDVRAQEFVVEGVPFAYILQKGGRLQGQAITISRQPDGLRCANRSGMKGRIQIDAAAGKRATP